MFINDHFTKITGYAGDDITSIEDWFLKAYPDKSYREKVLSDCQDGSSGENAEKIFEITCKSGEIKTIEFSVSFLPDDITMITLKDISDSENALAEVQLTRNTLNSIFKAAPTGIGMVRDRVFMQVNDTLCRMVGYSKKELIGQSSRILYPSVEDFHHVGKTKCEQLSARGTGTVETRWLHKNGNILNILLSSTPININDWKQGVTFTALDITERKQMEKALKKSEARYRQFFEEIMSGAFISTPDGKLLDCNQELVRIFGFDSRQAALSCNLNDLYRPPSTRPRFLDSIHNNKGVRNFRSNMKKQDGTPLEIVENAYGVFDKNDRLTSIRGYLSDITEMVRMENRLRQAQKMEAVGTLVGGISHDFNNLLQAIIGYSELLCLQKTKDDPDYEKLRALRQTSKRAGDLVKRLLIFSRDAQTQKKLININKEVTHGKKLLEKTIPRMIAIQMDLEKDLWPVEADPLQMEQVILNLGSNASDAMPDGGLIHIATRNTQVTPRDADTLSLPPGEYVKITVSDSGHGMDAETHEKIFEPFFTTKQPGKGTGLGLSSVYGIIKNHDGHISCKTRQGKGTTFTFHLPALKGQAVRAEGRSLENIKKGKETILVVDDEEAIRHFASQAFKKMGYTFLEAVNGEDAIEIFKKQNQDIDLILLDLSMPGMGGFKCLQQLILMDKDIKVLMASGYSADATIEDCLKAGAVDYIRKPYQLKALFEKIREILDSNKP